MRSKSLYLYYNIYKGIEGIILSGQYYSNNHLQNTIIKVLDLQLPSSNIERIITHRVKILCIPRCIRTKSSSFACSHAHIATISQDPIPYRKAM
jgi:hypothetical protein